MNNQKKYSWEYLKKKKITQQSVKDSLDYFPTEITEKNGAVLDNILVNITESAEGEILKQTYEERPKNMSENVEKIINLLEN